MRFTTTGLLVSISPHHSNIVRVIDWLTIDGDVLQFITRRHISRFGIGCDLGWKFRHRDRSRFAVGNPATTQKLHRGGSKAGDAPRGRLRRRSKQPTVVYFDLDLAVDMGDATEADDRMAHVETGSYITG